MRWASEKLSTNVCFEEIKNCQKKSIGPSFVAFLSHLYGAKVLKLKIPKIEFELLKRNRNFSSNKENSNLLESFYEFDDNNIMNKEYKLKPENRIISELKVSF